MFYSESQLFLREKKQQIQSFLCELLTIDAAIKNEYRQTV